MASFKFEKVYINDYYTLIGPVEKNGKLKKCNYEINDYYFGEKSFEKAESKMICHVINNLLYNNRLFESDIDLIVGGDLSNQLGSTSYAIRNFNIPFLGVYSACSTFIESLILSANLISSGKVNNIIVTTSSHNLVSERQFRFPVEYGSIRKEYSTYTITGAVSTLVTNKDGLIKIESATIGKIVDMGIKDSFYMGAVMAPSCADTIYNHLKSMNREVNYYDLILTGDLGCIGLKILKKYYKELYGVEINNIKDGGCEIYSDCQDTYTGGSGPTSIALSFFNKILQNKKYKKILLVGTGSLHSKLKVNQKESIPAISHAISLEVKR